MDTIYNIDNTAIESLIQLLNEDFDEVNEEAQLAKVDFLHLLATDLGEDFLEDGNDPVVLYVVGKHLEEFSKTLKDVAKEDALSQLLDQDFSSGEFLGSKITFKTRNNDEVIPSKKLTQLRRKLEGLKNAIKQEEKKLKDDGEVEEKDPTYSITVSKK